MMRITWNRALLAAFVPLWAVGCTSNGAPAAGGQSTSDSKSSHVRVGIVFDSGGRGDKSFNDSAWRGVQRAQKDFGIPDSDIKTVDSKSEKDYEGNLTGMADTAHCNVVFAVGIS